MINDLIKIDGSFGEGGGQILRTSLSLSAITKRPFEIYNIRAGRKNPGLRPQHLQAVNATAQICNARVIGAEVGSTNLTFFPGETKGGKFQFDIGTAGSVSLVLQTIFLPLCLADQPSGISIKGGTHVPFSPCFHYLKLQWTPYMNRIGFDIDIDMKRAGFYPKGNGEIGVAIKPVGHIDNFSKMDNLTNLLLKERGGLKVVRGISSIGNLDINIANRQRRQVLKRLSEHGLSCEIDTETMVAFGKGTMVLLLASFDNGQCCYFSLGAIGKRAEDVANEACDGLIYFMRHKGVIDEHMADQILLPLALCKGISCIATPKVTQHILTNIETIKIFLPVKIEVEGNVGDEGVITINA